MPLSRLVRHAMPLALLLALPVCALETGELELKAGFVDPSSGVKIEKVTLSDKDQIQEVTVSVPQSAGTIDEIVVTAPREKARTTVQQKKRFELLKDFEHDRYGLVIYLDRNQKLPLRLYFDNSQVNDDQTKASKAP